MSLDTQLYFFFFACVFAGFFRFAPRWRWAWLLAGSYVFYFIASPAYFYLLPAATLISYAAARVMRPGRREWPIGIAILALILLLIGFKYSETVFEPVNTWLGAHGFSFQFSILHHFYPVGIAFFILQAIGYLIDVRRGEIEPEAHLGKYALFLGFFPTLISGPIERAGHLLPQLNEPAKPDRPAARDGAALIYGGLFKKIVVADFLAQLVIPAFQNPHAYSGGALLLATIASRYRLYCDFSGYTDIARGSAKLLGIDLARNFNRPFRATTIGDFWQRWHISLSSWMRDYVYYPLIMSPARLLGLYANVVLTFTLLGLWHAGTACFAVFGLIQGVLIVLHDSTAKGRARWNARLGFDAWPRTQRVARILITFFFFACLPMVFFSSGNLHDAFFVYRQILTPHDWWNFSLVSESLGVKAWGLVVIIALLEYGSSRVGEVEGSPLRAWLAGRPRWLVYTILFVMGVLLLAASVEFKRTDFVYRKF